MKLVHLSGQGLTRILSDQVKSATTFKARSQGLLGCDSIQELEVVYFPFTNLIHTIGMRFSIDCIFTNNRNEIIKVASQVKPYRIVGVLQMIAHVFETKSGNAEIWNLRVGDRLYVDH